MVGTLSQANLGSRKVGSEGLYCLAYKWMDLRFRAPKVWEFQVEKESREQMVGTLNQATLGSMKEGNGGLYCLVCK